MRLASAKRFLDARFAWLIAAVTLIGAALRFPTLGLQSYWYDEAVTVKLVRSGPYSMLRSLPGSESTPPLYYVVAWVWARIFSTTEAELRSLSAVCGTLAIPLAYVAGKELVSRPAGALAATLAAVSPFLIWYSQEARAYALFVLLTTASLALFARAWSSPSRKRCAWWAVVSALALWTQYFAFFLVAVEALLLLARRATRQPARLPVLGVGLAAAAVAPLAYHQSQSTLNDWIAAQALRARATDTIQWFLAGPYSLSHPWWTSAALSAIGLTAVMLLSTSQERRGATLSLALGSACILLPLVAAGLGEDFWLYRNLIAAWIPLAIVLGSGLATRRRVGIVLRVGLVGVTAGLLTFSTVAAITVSSGHSATRTDWRGLAQCLGPARTARILLVSPAYQRIALRLYRPNVRPLPDGAHDVAEIDVVGGFPDGFTIPAGFHRSGRSCTRSIQIDRLRSPTRRAVPPPGLDAVLLADKPGP
jgi:mannosyltransferase